MYIFFLCLLILIHQFGWANDFLAISTIILYWSSPPVLRLCPPKTPSETSYSMGQPALKSRSSTFICCILKMPSFSENFEGIVMEELKIHKLELKKKFLCLCIKFPTCRCTWFLGKLHVLSKEKVQLKPVNFDKPKFWPRIIWKKKRFSGGKWVFSVQERCESVELWTSTHCPN